MKFTVLTLFPEMILSGTRYGVLGQALDKSLIELKTINPRDFATDNYKTVDDRPFGGGDGMIMQAEVVAKAIQSAKNDNPDSRVIYLSPQGVTLNEQKVLDLAKHKSLILVSARYGGLDQRVINSEIDEELSIGDYVLSGGEIAALAVIDSVARKIPGVLGHQESALKDSFSEELLEAPQFTRPQKWNEQTVPEVLCGGHHALIEEWKEQMSWIVTKQKRPDLFHRAWQKKMELDPKKARKFFEKLQGFYMNLSSEERRATGIGEKDENFWKDVKIV